MYAISNRDIWEPPLCKKQKVSHHDLDQNFESELMDVDEVAAEESQSARKKRKHSDSNYLDRQNTFPQINNHTPKSQQLVNTKVSKKAAENKSDKEDDKELKIEKKMPELYYYM